MADPVRVVIADDDVLLREGLASLLERAGFDVVAQAGDGPQLLELVRSEARSRLALLGQGGVHEQINFEFMQR
jgi:DNA-binding NarL/FixJ family response regulator